MKKAASATSTFPATSLVKDAEAVRVLDRDRLVVVDRSPCLLHVFGREASKPLRSLPSKTGAWCLGARAGLVAAARSSLEVFDVESGKTLIQDLRAPEGIFEAVAISAVGDRIATVYSQPTAKGASVTRIEVFSRDGAHAIVAEPKLPFVNGINFSVDGRSVFMCMEEANGPYLLCWELETGKVTRIAGGPGNVKLRVGADGHLIARFSNRVCVYGPDLRDLASNPLLEIAGERRGAFPGFGSAGCVDADFVDGVLLVAAGNRVHRFSKAGRYLGEQRASGEVRSIASTGDVLALVALPSRGDIKLRLELHPLTSGAAKVSAARPQRPAARTSPTKRTKVDVVALRTMMKQLAALQPKGARPKPPTTKKELTALEKTLGQRVPDDLGALLEHCDGELRFGDFTFYRAKQIAKAHAMWTDLFAGEDEDEDEDEHGWNTAWTPFAGSSTGDVLCLTPQREVVLVFHADTRRPELAPSLSSLIQTVVKRLGSDKKRDPIYGYLKS